MRDEFRLNRLLVRRLRSGLDLDAIVNTVIDLDHVLTGRSLDDSSSIVQLILC